MLDPSILWARRLAAALLAGAVVLASPLMAAAPASAKPPGGAGKPPQPAYAKPVIAESEKDTTVESPRPLSLSDKRPPQPAQPDGPGTNIVGGAPASIGEYPYFVSLRWGGSHICGGSLMSTTKVLTAAHCVEGMFASELQVHIGGTELFGTDTGVVRNVALIQIYPSWDPVTLRYDVAVLTLSTPITRADSAVRWLRLARGNELGLVDAGDPATVVGHGRTSVSAPASNALLELPVVIQSDAVMTNQFGGAFDSITMMGAGGTPAGGQGACYGDSGGPLVITSTPQHIQIGDVSWGNPCAVPGYADVYGELYQGNMAGFVDSLVGRPANDNFSGATTLPGNAGAIAGDNTNATLEPTESGTEIETTVWYRWKPSETGTAQVTVNQHAFDSEVRIYTGTAVTALTLVASNNDANGSLQSEVEFAAVTGQVYYIQVDGYQFDYGRFRLSYAVNRPSNDDFAGATAIAGTSACPVIASTAKATGQAGEPSLSTGVADASIWYSWTASAAGTARITTAGSDFDTTLTAYTGSALTALTAVAANDDFNGTRQSQITFAVPAAGTYRIQVGAFNGARGTVRLGFALNPEANDLFSAPQVLTGASGTVSGSNLRSLAEPGEPASLPNPNSSVWYRWTAPANGTFRFTTTGSTFDTELASLTGTAITGLTPLAVNDDDGAVVQSRIQFAATANMTYWIWVDGFACARGSIQLNWAQI